MPVQTPRPVLILGAGINGAAIARELVLNRVPVVVVDQADIASGTTAYSSRLIHGGLRYLEHREFALVRESLEERERLLRLAPDFVKPLELFIPVARRWGGLMGAPRGLWMIRSGLWLYDRFARGDPLPRHQVHRANEGDVPRVDAQHFRWMCSYWDAQIVSPERFTIALLQDAREFATEAEVDFQVLPYHRARLLGATVALEPRYGQVASETEFTPSLVINATGAWVDRTLSALRVPAPELIGGTKGSHLFTWHAGLQERLSGRAVYVEARDGRPVFVLPLDQGTLIGTTDLPYTGDPADARTSQPEIEYLLSAVEQVFGDLQLNENHIAWHYSGVRPLPYVDAGSPAAITRRHWLHAHDNAPVPLVSIVGGKLTTCRSLAEEVAARVCSQLEVPRLASSRERPIPDRQPQVESPHELARWSVQHTWAHTLGDLVERRLMLLYDRSLSPELLHQLAQLLVDHNLLTSDEVDAAVDTCATRLQTHFGLHCWPESSAAQ